MRPQLLAEQLRRLGVGLEAGHLQAAQPWALFDSPLTTAVSKIDSGESPHFHAYWFATCSSSNPVCIDSVRYCRDNGCAMRYLRRQWRLGGNAVRWHMRWARPLWQYLLYRLPPCIRSSINRRSNKRTEWADAKQNCSAVRAARASDGVFWLSDDCARPCLGTQTLRQTRPF